MLSGPRTLPCSRLFLLLLSLTTASVLCGCADPGFIYVGGGAVSLTGVVQSGLQPVSNATVQLYIAGKTGNGSVSTTFLSPVQTNSTGGFTLKGECLNATDQLYITATGGNPGLAAGTNNTSLVLVAALGSCANIANFSTISINEVTTVAAAWALAPYIGSSAANIGSSSTNGIGLANAFLNAQLLANTSTGLSPTLSSTLTVQTGKLYALADAISPCASSSVSTSAACAALFAAATPTGGSATAANSFAALSSIVRHPSDINIVPSVWALVALKPPFATTLTQAPHDWTMTLSITGGGLSSPEALAIDTFGNVWVADYNGGLSAFSPQGTAFNSTGYGTSILAECFGLTIDTSGNIWITNYEAPNNHGSVSKFLGASSGTPGSPVTNTTNNSYYFYDSTIDYPVALSADSNGNIGIANSANSTATIYSSAGAVVSSGLGYGNASTPLAIAFDSSHGLWLADYGDSSVTHINSSNGLLAHVASCCSGADGIAVDASGNAWVANYAGQNVYAVNSSGGGIASATGGGLSSNNSQPVGIAIDAGDSIWVANGNGANITQLTGTGIAISPSTGYGLDAGLSDPHSIAPDASGNIWVSDFGKNEVVMFFGLAAPTVTPVQAIPTAP